MHENTKRFLSSEVPPCSPQEARFHVIPVPYEATVSYMGGTRRGPDAILEASDQLELFDGTGYPGEKGIFTQPAVDCSGSAEQVMERIAGAVRYALQCHAIPIALGGEHALTYGELKALHEIYGAFGVIQFDAHADLRDTYDGTKWSHACAMRRAVDDLGLPLVQFGNRIFCREELEVRKRCSIMSWDAPTLHHEGTRCVTLPDTFPENIFITFDVDGLDPSVIAETGTPVPGGLGWQMALDIIHALSVQRRIIGADVVELSPRQGHVVSDFAAAMLTYVLMGAADRSSPC
ncbi:MAG: agmatinase [Mailhella sp.]|nr:agmatinase [Mailhella sp.]